jgi:hypothetical protein
MNNIPEEQDFEVVSLIEKLLSVPERSPLAIAEGKTRFLAEARVYQSSVSARPERRQIEWKNIFSRKAHPTMATISTLFLIFAILFGGTGATVYAAQGSLPDQALYSVKLASEDVRAGLATSDQNRLELALNFADNRLDEALQLAAEGKTIPGSVWERLEAQVDLALHAAAELDDVQFHQQMLQIQSKIAANLYNLGQFSGDNRYSDAAVKAQAALQNDLQLIALGLQDPAAFRQWMGADQHHQNWQMTPPASSVTPLPTLQTPTLGWQPTDDHGWYATPWPNSTNQPQWHDNDCHDCGRWNGSGLGGRNSRQWNGSGSGNQNSGQWNGGNSGGPGGGHDGGCDYGGHH